MKGQRLSFSDEDNLQVSSVKTTVSSLAPAAGRVRFPVSSLSSTPFTSCCHSYTSIPAVTRHSHVHANLHSGCPAHSSLLCLPLHLQQSAITPLLREERITMTNNLTLKGKNVTRQSRFPICKGFGDQNEPMHLHHLRKQGRPLPTIFPRQQSEDPF